MSDYLDEDNIGNRYEDDETIHGVVILGEPIYQEGVYQVVVGYLVNAKNQDVPHYLIINVETSVIEGSSARLFEARSVAAAFNAELKSQDNLIAKGVGLVELQTSTSDSHDEPEEPAKKASKKKDRTWN